MKVLFLTTSIGNKFIVHTFRLVLWGLEHHWQDKFITKRSCQEENLSSFPSKISSYQAKSSGREPSIISQQNKFLPSKVVRKRTFHHFLAVCSLHFIITRSSDAQHFTCCYFLLQKTRVLQVKGKKIALVIVRSQYVYTVVLICYIATMTIIT